MFLRSSHYCLMCVIYQERCVNYCCYRRWGCVIFTSMHFIMNCIEHKMCSLWKLFSTFATVQHRQDPRTHLAMKWCKIQCFDARSKVVWYRQMCIYLSSIKLVCSKICYVCKSTETCAVCVWRLLIQVNIYTDQRFLKISSKINCTYLDNISRYFMHASTCTDLWSVRGSCMQVRALIYDLYVGRACKYVHWFMICTWVVHASTCTDLSSVRGSCVQVRALIYHLYVGECVCLSWRHPILLIQFYIFG